MTLLMLPLLAFVAAQDPEEGQRAEHLERRRAVNGTELLLECPPAAHLVRTHMAPDFEQPQLVRRLDWVHDGALVASFQQDLLSSAASEQRWVAGPRFELRRPFFALRIWPLLPADAGQWRCRLETDPLFAPELPPSSATEVLVLVRPPVPPRPVVAKHSDRSVSLHWNQYSNSVLPAHRPVLRFSVLVAQPDDGSLRVLSTENNQTTAHVDGLRPNSRYSFSVRAENAVGESAFGPETVFRTVGLPPKLAPQIVSVRNGSSAECVDLEWALPPTEREKAEPTPVVGFRVMVHRVGTGAMREWYVKGGKAREQLLCSLEPFTDYVLTLEADNGFGYSPGATAPFRTDEAAPGSPPQLVQCRPVPGGETISCTWREPLTPNGAVSAYVIAFKNVPSQREESRLTLQVRPEEPSKAFAFNLTRLAANTRYKVRLAAATSKGPGTMSDPLFVDTDYAASRDAPTVTNLTYGCESSLLSLHWFMAPTALPAGAECMFRIAVHSSMGVPPVRVFNMSAKSPHKMLLENVQLGERLSLSVAPIVRSRVDPKVLLEGPASAPAHFALIANGWRCRFRSSACPPLSALPQNAICEHFAPAPMLNADQLLAASGQPNEQKGDANVSFIFLIFGVAIFLAVSALFACMLRRRCPLFKKFLRKQKKDKKQPNRGTTGGQKKGPESVSLMQRNRAATTDGPESVVLPPITLPPNGTGSLMAVSGEADNTLQNGGCCAFREGDETKNGPTVSVLHFDAYFEEMSANGGTGFRRQFKEIEQETASMLEREMAESEGEKTKNRYIDISALPRRSRIRLGSGGQQQQECGQHYINANYVDSCDERRIYIATQAPLPHTFADFWAMVWQERSQVLVALTNLLESGRRKCDQYWPDRVGECAQAGQFRVTLSAERSNSVFTHRVLLLTRLDAHKGGPADRTVHQLHFMAWPDHGVPDSPFPLLHFVNYVAELQSPAAVPAAASGPCVVHCSAGVGRSGAFILIDSLRKHLLHCDRIDVAGQLRRMRRQRAQLVQTLEQFIFCHEVLRHLVANGITRQPRAHFANYVRFLLSQRTPSGQRRIRAQFLDLLACPHRPSRCPLPPKCIPSPGYHRTDEFLICGLKPDSIELWQQLWTSGCQSIVLLDSSNEGNVQLERVPCGLSRDEQKNIQISLEGEDRLKMRSENGREELCIRIHRVSSTALLHKPWVQIERLQRELSDAHRGQLAVMELGTAQPSALPFIFCAFQSAACQLEQEGAVDVLLWLASYKHIVCGCWTEQAEVELIYRKVLELVELQKTLC